LGAAAGGAPDQRTVLPLRRLLGAAGVSLEAPCARCAEFGVRRALGRMGTVRTLALFFESRL